MQVNDVIFINQRLIDGKKTPYLSFKGEREDWPYVIFLTRRESMCVSHAVSIGNFLITNDIA